MPEVGQSACNRYTDELCGIFNYMPLPENFRNGFRTSRPQISPLGGRENRQSFLPCAKITRFRQININAMHIFPKFIALC